MVTKSCPKHVESIEEYSRLGFDSPILQITEVNPLARSGGCTSEMMTKRLTKIV